MEQRKRTLDNMGSRIRPRDYSSMYANRRKQAPKLFSDIISRPVTNQVAEVEKAAIDSAKKLITPLPVKLSVIPQSKKITNQVPKNVQRNKVVRPASIINQDISLRSHTPLQISDMVVDIQQNSNPTSDPENLTALKKEPGRIKQTLSNMFETRRSIALSALSTLLLVGGVVALAGSFTTNQKVEAQVKVLTEVASASIDNESLASDEGIPSEDPVPEPVVNSYSPPADEPRYIYVPKLKNKKTRVLKMGLDKNGAIQTPRTTWDTGWYEDSSKPGDVIGASFIVGHVSGLTTGGVFYNLYRLENDDEIIIETGDGTKYTYKVVGKEEVPLEGINMNNYLVSKDIDKPGLTLMTCAGEYNPITQTYDNRLAVFAVRQS